MAEETPAKLGNSERTLTLKALHERLTDNGLEISYKSLSDFTSTDDVASQLGGTGGRNRLAFPMSAAKIIQGFMPYYHERKGRLPQAAGMLRDYLTDKEGVEDFSGTRELSRSSAHASLVPVSEKAVLQLAATIEGFTHAVTDASPLREDIALTRSQAAVLLACAESGVSRLVPPLRRGVYRRSDCLRYLASGVPIISEARRKNHAKADIPNIRLSENSRLLHSEGQQ